MEEVDELAFTCGDLHGPAGFVDNGLRQAGLKQSAKDTENRSTFTFPTSWHRIVDWRSQVTDLQDR